MEHVNEFKIIGVVSAECMLHHLGDEGIPQTQVLVEIKEKGYRGRTFESKACVQFWREQAEEIADSVKGLKVGDLVEIRGTIQSREWDSKWYTNLQGYEYKVVGAGEVNAGEEEETF